MKQLVMLMLCLILTVPALGQGLEDNVSEYSSANGQLYLQPLADAFGANINSGWFSTARIPRYGIRFQFGLKAMAAFITESQKTFSPVPESGFNPPSGTELPTVFGDEEGVEIPGLGVSVPGVWNTSYFPMVVPQLTVGSFFGTEASIRYISLRINEEIGQISLFGWGIRHSLSQYIPLIPFDIAAGYFWQQFKVGDLVEANASLAGLQASYSLSVLTLYAGLGLESSTLNVKYLFEEEGESVNVQFDLKGTNRFRTTLGIALNLPVIKIHADYNMGSQNTACAGVSFGF
ncbi:MAG TPA: hypothetical protein ENN03_08705 [bacterium]|nr:hypothetical protein [bacterium]